MTYNLQPSERGLDEIDSPDFRVKSLRLLVSTVISTEICPVTRLQQVSQATPFTELLDWIPRMEEEVKLSSPLGTEQNLSEFITPNLLPQLSLKFPGTLFDSVLRLLKQTAEISRGIQ